MGAAQQRYLDFELSVEHLGGERYRAVVRDMPLGEGQGQVSNGFTMPFAEDALARTLAIFSGQLHVSETERLGEARAFGETLFKAVFAGPVYTVYFSSRDRARTAAGLRIKLDLEGAGPLASLPWEFLRDPNVDYLALSRATPVIRYPRRLVIRPRPVFELPLRVLVMVSSPADLPPVDVAAEWGNLQAATKTLRESGKLELILLEDASLRTLQRMLRDGEYHAFHYIGHSMRDPVSGQGMLALEDPFGEDSSYPVRGEDLARELSEENAIRLVVLNSCQSSEPENGDPFAGIASSLVARGIPAVVAMQAVISDPAAQAFSEEFYRAVSGGLPVDAAMSEARRAIGHAVGGVEWAVPVLHLRAADGLLFDFGEPEMAAAVPGRTRMWIAAGGVALVALVIAALVLLTRGPGDPEPDAPIDVRIADIQVIPARPSPGERTAVIVTIVNDSTVALGPISYDFREDVLDSEPDLTDNLATIAPGAEATVVIPHMFSWWGAFVAEVRIDVDSVIAETDEFNNIRRSPVLTDDGPFAVDFVDLPGPEPIVESMPLAPDAFSAWGFRIEALENGDQACGGVVPWVFVNGTERFLGTALPDDETVCRDAGLALVLEQGAVGSVLVELDVTEASTQRLTAFATGGRQVDQDTQNLGTGQQFLELSGGFPAPLEIRRAELAGVPGVPTRVTRLELADPLR